MQLPPLEWMEVSVEGHQSLQVVALLLHMSHTGADVSEKKLCIRKQSGFFHDYNKHSVLKIISSSLGTTHLA